MKQPPVQQGVPARRLALAAILHQPQPVGTSLADHRQLQKNIDAIFAGLPLAPGRLLDPVAVCFDDSRLSRMGDSIGCYYADSNHLSPLGAEQLLRPLLQPVFAEIEADLRQ